MDHSLKLPSPETLVTGTYKDKAIGHHTTLWGFYYIPRTTTPSIPGNYLILGWVGLIG